MKLVSIITINLNNSKGLLKTIDSVRSQNDTINCEFIVIDGNSNDDSKELIKKNADIITKFNIENDKGIYDAMNKGILIANGNYLIFMNSGDTFYNNTVIKDSIITLRDNKSNIVYGKTNLIYENGATQILEEVPEKMNINFLLTSTINHQSCFIKRQFIIQLGLYNLKNSYISDYDFFLKAYNMLPNSFKYINSVIANYQLNGISSNTNNHLRIIEERERIQLKYYTKEIITEINSLEKIKKHNYFWLIQKSETNKILNTILYAISKFRIFLYKLFH